MIAVIGLGFVGLTTALGFAEKGYKVKGFDVDQNKLESFKNYKVPFYEAGLEDALKNHLNSDFFIADSFTDTVKDAKVIFYCVGTPGKEDGSADLTYLKIAIDDTLKTISKDDYPVLVIKSTVPPSATTDEIKPYIENLNFKVGKDLGLANNPEFLRKGYAWDDFIYPDRVVLGCEDEKSTNILKELYKPFNAPIHIVSYNSGEFIKYLSNTLLSTLISYANEMSMIAKGIGNIDIADSFKILHEDARWSGTPAKMSSYVYPGCGYGGYCLPKDTEALVMISKKKGFEPKILEKNLEINAKIKGFLIDELSEKIAKSEVVGILGLSFKPDSDDIRHSPSLAIINKLLEKGYKNIIAYDPMANEIFSKTYNLPIHYAKNLNELISQTDQNILVTSWHEFKENSDLIKTKPLHDLRYFL